MKKHPNIGATLDSLFEELGELEEVQLLTAKRVLAQSLQHRMAELGLRKAALAKKMKTSRAALDRLLDPDDTGVTLATIARATTALSLELVGIQVRPIDRPRIRVGPASSPQVEEYAQATRYRVGPGFAESAEALAYAEASAFEQVIAA